MTNLLETIAGVGITFVVPAPPSSSASSSSKSSSSNSELHVLGSGWPFAPDQIQVIIGTRWNDENVPFAEDEEIRLIRYTSAIPGWGTFSEDGTDIYDVLTNRLNMVISGDVMLRVATGSGTSAFGSAVRLHYVTQYEPYNFRAIFEASFSFNFYAWQPYMDVNTHYYFSPSMNWNGEVFKSITFIDN